MKRFFLLSILPLILFAGEWTALVYMAADNGLAQWADSDLVEMEAIGSNDDVSILVQVDKPYIGARRLLVGNGTSYELQDLGITDMCDWQILADFLEWGIRTYPADKYFVILWDHGTGWTLTPRRSFGSDWSSGNQLSISNGDFKKAISTAYNYTGEKINLFAFDACLMQQIEVAFEIKDYAKIFLASQTICPLQGFRYDIIFEELCGNPGINEIELAKSIVDINVANYTNIQPVVYSAINLEKLNKLKECSSILISSLVKNSPNQSIIDLRENVQTIPVVIGQIPYPDDEHVDMGDFITGLNGIISGTEIEQLVGAYNNTIIKSDYWGDDFSRTTGLTIWFPPDYRLFKQLLNYYVSLTWTRSLWLQFLNWFYGEDDIRPTPVQITKGNIGKDNDFRLSWHKSYDLASVTYSVMEIEDTILIFEDQCENTDKWNVNGFTLSGNNVYSGNYSFFSGNASYLQNWVETQELLFIEDFGLLHFYLYYNTEDINDSLIIEFGPFKDVHYGRSNGWQERRVIIPPGNYRLKISYHTNGSINRGGCYIDDIEILYLRNSRYLRQYCADTTIYIFNKLRGEYYYAVYPEDKYENTGNLSNITRIVIENFALPYSNPNPFQTSCDIILDYPDSLYPEVEIFSISGRRVKKFETGEIENKTVFWNGKDENNRDVGSGLYYILLKDGSFNKIGKIARQR